MPKKSCDCLPNDVQLVEKLQKDLDKRIAVEYADFFKALSDENRIQIMLILFENEVTVNDIAVVLDMTKSTVSHQLKILKTHGHVKCRRQGKNIYYSLDDEHIFDILKQVKMHIIHFNPHE